jgi:hypothetical protein
MKPKNVKHDAWWRGNCTATGVITYLINGKRKKWSIGCMAWEKPDMLKDHLKTWIPKAVFVSGKIVPDNKTASVSSLHANKVDP